MGYRYYDKKKMKVLFPFGFGLSYTNFEYSNLVVSSDSILDTDTITVTVDVKNTGHVAGKEVVQLYVADRESTVFRPIRELKGYEKVWLAPGETKNISFQLSKRSFAYWNVELHDWHVESGVFGIQIGRDSRNIVLEKDITVTSTTSVPKVFTRNSITMDIMQSPKALAALKPMLDGLSQMLSGDAEPKEPTEGAASNEMMQAMLGYLPLRSMASFAGGAISEQQLNDLIQAMNE